MKEHIHTLLYSIGLSENYVGFHHLAAGVEIAAQSPESLLMVTKWLYPEIAKRCKSNWKAVERNIRTMLHVVWRQSPEELERIAGCPLHQRPAPARFLAILTRYYLRSYTCGIVEQPHPNGIYRIS